MTDWSAARTDFEGGMSFRAIGRKYDVSHSAVRKHALRENWQREDHPTTGATVAAPGATESVSSPNQAATLEIEKVRRALHDLDQRTAAARERLEEIRSEITWKWMAVFTESAGAREIAPLRQEAAEAEAILAELAPVRQLLERWGKQAARRAKSLNNGGN